MNRPIVSVLIPVYNVEKYLEKCLDSVIGQSLTNIEIICVDDGSTDGSSEILKKYQLKDKRIKVVTKENGGLPSARNAGLDHAQGKYVGFVDSDDYIEKNMFKKLVKTAEDNNSDIVICGANIFPETPKASRWYYTCLSPEGKHYDSFNAELLFERPDTTPFLWRVLVKRELIEGHHLRLDEDIHIGEDKAFQCKIYSYAKGITVIPDKLYNYYWCRPDSLMGAQVHGNLENRVLAHSRLVERIAGDLSSQKIGEEAIEKFLHWSIPFIYDDFIYLSEENKKIAADRLIPVWKNIGYYQFFNELPIWKKEMFDYIKLFTDVSSTIPVLSIVMPIEYTSRYVEEQLRRVKDILSENIELIIINNGMQYENYLQVQKFLSRNTKARLYNTPKHISYAESLNTGVQLAAGDYLLFLEPQDWITSSKQLQEWLQYAKNGGAELCICGNCQKKSLVDTGSKILQEDEYKKYILEQDYHCCLYKKSFLEEAEIYFSEASILTGYIFLCQAVLAAKKVTQYQEYIYVLREMHTADWISTEKCELLLKGLKLLAELSVTYHDAALHGKVYSLLNGDKLKQIIVNNTKPYVMPPQNCPNGENSQIEAVGTIFEILELADHEMLSEYGFQDTDSIISILYDVVLARQVFLGELSGKQVS